jgi:hypothetical protein
MSDEDDKVEQELGEVLGKAEAGDLAASLKKAGEVVDQIVDEMKRWKEQ